jgi:hypothetical protein
MKKVRSYGTVELRKETKKWRARTSRADGHKTIGNFQTKELAELALQDFIEKNNIEINEDTEDAIGQDSKKFAEITNDNVEISTGVVESPITNWDNILISFGLDPEVFQVVDDKVRMSKWQSSKRLENGDRDLIWLYSYKATFIKRQKPLIKDIDFNELRKNIRSFKAPIKNKTDDLPSTFVICWADWQLAKSASGGVKATTERIINSFAKTISRIKELRKLGRNINEIAFVNMGDPIESCDGHYASQLFSVELTQREQLLLALDLWSIGVREIAPLAEKTKFIGTLSNHGEWQRRGGKSITTDSDNADGFLIEALARIYENSDYKISWNIPHDEMVTQVNLSGIETAFTHGHKISGKEQEWLRGQTLRQIKDCGKEPTLWFTAHKHHIRVDDFGAFTRFQCPSLDSDGSSSGGSKWFADSQGWWSSPGTLTLLVGKHDKRGWSDMEVL